MIRRMLLASGIVFLWMVICAIGGAAQTAPAGHWDKTEIALTAEYMRSDLSLADLRDPRFEFLPNDTLGGMVSLNYFFNNKPLGMTVEGSYNKRGRVRHYTTMAGITLKKRSGIFRPFVTATGGISLEFPSRHLPEWARLDHGDLGAAVAGGVGFDVKLGGRVQWRVIRADYLVTDMFSGRTPRQHARFGTGLVF